MTTAWATSNYRNVFSLILEARHQNQHVCRATLSPGEFHLCLFQLLLAVCPPGLTAQLSLLPFQVGFASTASFKASLHWLPSCLIPSCVSSFFPLASQLPPLSSPEGCTPYPRRPHCQPSHLWRCLWMSTIFEGWFLEANSVSSC